MKNKKKICIYASVVFMLSLLGVASKVIMQNAFAEETAEETAVERANERKELAAPENLRYEDGFIVWDAVENAYGYTLKLYVNDDTRSFKYYVNQVELDRFCYENDIDFGEYQFEVCTFDESGVESACSNSITASYAPTFNIPQNVRHSEDGKSILWDEVEGAVRYNIRIFRDDSDGNRVLYSRTYESRAEFRYYYLSTSGDYWVAIQAMDQDYNVSEWTEPILVSYTAATVEELEAPKNLRFDESGENILWDEVEGADYYYVWIRSYADSGERLSEVRSVEQPMYTNWKSCAWPFSNGEYEISVSAHGNGFESKDSDSLKANFQLEQDASISVPDSIQVEDGSWKWEEVEGAKNYWLFISINGEKLGIYEGIAGFYYGSGDGDVINLPEGTYEVKLFVMDENNNYNSKTYSVNVDRVHDKTVWVPEMFYKFENIFWDYDRLRHENTSGFWIRVKQGETVVKLKYSGVEHFYGLSELANGDYTVEVCVSEYDKGDKKLGEWSTPLEITKHDGGLFDKENEFTLEVESPEGAEVPEEDRITSITINPAFNMKDKDNSNVELDLAKITVKASEIYDEEGLKRVEEALGETIKGYMHYNLLDLLLFYDGKDYSNGYDGLVQVIFSIPEGHRDKTFTCYRLTEVDGKITKEIIPGTQTEDSYIVYLEHFSEYVLVGEGKHTHIYGENWESDETSHWKGCECGEKSEEAAHTYGDWTITKEATEAEEGARERSCGICSYKQIENLPKLTPSAPSNPPAKENTSSNPSGEENVSGLVPNIIIIPIGTVDVNNTSSEPTTTNASKTIADSPKTGDNFTISVVILPFLSILIASIATVVYNKKRKQLEI